MTTYPDFAVFYMVRGGDEKLLTSDLAALWTCQRE
jgi:hypothetical protein